MFRARSIQSSLSIKDKILSIDYILVISIFILGLTSILAMYSTDGGELKYHTQSHILRFFVFFVMFFVMFFVRIGETVFTVDLILVFIMIRIDKTGFYIGFNTVLI